VTNLVLCGFMGTGKTAAGRALARILGRPFADLDAEIEARAGRTVAEIFATEGEVGFRRREAAVVGTFAPPAGRILSTGGGVLTDAANREALAAGGTLVLLTADPEVLAERLAADSSRPLLADADEPVARITELMNQRSDIYAGIDTVIDTGGLTPMAVAVAVARAVGLPIQTTRIDVVGAEGHTPLAARDLDHSRVVTGPGALALLGDELRGRGVTGQVVLAMPPSVREHYDEVLMAAVATAGLDVTVLDVPDGDQQKSFRHAAKLVDRLADLGCDRDSCVVAVGGGVTGDLMGFVAALYMRGIALAMVPTTLLAMVDAHLGGKTAVNTPQAKNLAGAFHPPLLVLADPVTLETLPDHELANGLAEVVKTAIIGDAALFEALESTLVKAGPVGDRRPGPELLLRCVSSCAEVKGGVVSRDPWELGERRVLNLGHTLGHALEAQRELGLAHGEAVSLGLLAAGRLAVTRGLMPLELLGRCRRLLEACALPTKIPDVADEALRQRLSLDKKRRGEYLRFVLPRGLADVVVVDDVTDDEALAALGEERACASS